LHQSNGLIVLHNFHFFLCSDRGFLFFPCLLACMLLCFHFTSSLTNIIIIIREGLNAFFQYFNCVEWLFMISTLFNSFFSLFYSGLFVLNNLSIISYSWEVPKKHSMLFSLSRFFLLQKTLQKMADSTWREPRENLHKVIHNFHWFTETAIVLSCVLCCCVSKKKYLVFNFFLLLRRRLFGRSIVC
jgi:hypothetical protein